MFLINPALRLSVKYPAYAVTKAAKMVARSPETKQRIQSNYDEFAESFVRLGKARKNGVIEPGSGIFGKLVKDRINLFTERIKAIGKLFQRSKSNTAEAATKAADQAA